MKTLIYRVQKNRKLLLHLEIDLLEKGLDVEDLPCEWNSRYKKMLGVVPQNDTEGCLQDVHWSEGSFGYFPSYLLVHLVSLSSLKQKQTPTNGWN